MKNTSHTFLLVTLGSILGWLPSSASALTSTWVTGGSGNWGASSNWTSGSPGLSGNTNPYDTAVFGSSGGGTVILNASTTLGELDFSNGTSPYTISGSGTLNLTGAINGYPAIVSSGGSQAINTPITATGASWDGVDPVTFGPTSVDVNLADNAQLSINGGILGAGVVFSGSGNVFLTGPLSAPAPYDFDIQSQMAGSLTISNTSSNSSAFQYIEQSGTGPVYLASSNVPSWVTASGTNSVLYVQASGAAASVTANNGGVVDLGSTTNTVGSVALGGGSIVGTGALYLSTNVATFSYQWANLVSGKIAINLNGNEDVVQEGQGQVYSPTLGAFVTIPGGVTTLSGQNGYTGQTVVASGRLLIDGTNSGGGAIQIDPAAVNDQINNTYGGFLVAPSNNTAVLGGTGVATTSSVFVTNGGVIAPGDVDTNGNQLIGTLSIGSLTMSGGGLNFILGGASNSVLSVAGGISLSGTNFLSFSANAPLTGLSYTFLTWTGVLTGTFTATNLPAGYQLVTGSNSDWLQYENTNWSSQAIFAGTNAVIVGGSTNFAIALANPGLTDLGYSITSGTNTAGVLGSGTVSAGSTARVTGLNFTSTNIGVQTGSYTLTASNASPNVSVVNYTVSVLDHASGALGSSSVTLSNVIVGYKGAISTNLAITNAAGFRANLNAVSTSTSSNLTLGHVSELAAGSSSNAALTFAAGQVAGVYTNTVAVTFGDDPTLSGANTNLSTSTVSVTETIYNHASGSFAVSQVSLPAVHAGSTSSVTASVGVSNTAGLSVALSVTPTTNPTMTNGTLSVGSVNALAQGSSTNISLLWVPGKSKGTFIELVHFIFGDASTLNGANVNVGTANLMVTGGMVYSGQSTWTNKGSGNWASLASWDVAGGTPGLDGKLSVNDTATFGSSGSGSVTLNTNAALSSITLSNSTASYSIGGSGTLTLQNAAKISVLAGSHTLGIPLHLATNTTLLDNGSLNITGSVSGAALLVLNGNGTTTLAGTNTYSGGTTISGKGEVTGTTAGLQGNITDNATVVFNQMGTAGDYQGNLSGSGAVTVMGGIVGFKGTNSYKGGTLVTNAMLIGTTASLQGNITNNGSVVFDQAKAGIYAGKISGTGELIKTGTGTLSLSGVNSYSGGTRISLGTLVGNTVSLQGDITNNATLIFNQAKAGTYAGNVSGTGALVKSGAGVLSLGGSNSYSGGTLINSGTFSGTTASLQGNITNKAMLVFHQGGSGTYTGNINGTGKLAVTGAGTVTLVGSNSFTGGTMISLGTLAASSLGNGPVTISPATGQTADFIDTLGNGTLSIGALTLKSGSTVTIANPYGSIASTGAVSITGTNNFLDLEGAWTNLGTYALITGTKVTGSGFKVLDLTGSFLGGEILSLGSSTNYGGLFYTFSSSGNAIDLQVSSMASASFMMTRFPAEESVGASEEIVSVEAVPEPSTWGLLMMVTVLLMAIRYRRKVTLRHL